jgi:hypothetical protein
VQIALNLVILIAIALLAAVFALLERRQKKIQDQTPPLTPPDNA